MEREERRGRKRDGVTRSKGPPGRIEPRLLQQALSLETCKQVRQEFKDMKDISIFITTSGFIFIVVAFLFLGNNNAALIKLIAWIRECANVSMQLKKTKQKKNRLVKLKKKSRTNRFQAELQLRPKVNSTCCFSE